MRIFVLFIILSGFCFSQEKYWVYEDSLYISSFEDFVCADSNTYYQTFKYTDLLSTGAINDVYIRKTEDFGQSWDTIWTSKGIPEYPKDIYELLINENIIHGISEDGFSIKSTDFGKTWDTLNIFEYEPFNSKITNDGFATLLFNPSDLKIKGFNILNDEFFELKQINLDSVTIDDVICTEKNKFLLTTNSTDNKNNNSVFLTEDAGQTYDTVFTGNLYLNRLFFINKNIGFLTGLRRQVFDRRLLIYKTNDGGKSWYKVYSPDINVNEVKMLKNRAGNKIIAYTKNHYMLNSEDMGETWKHTKVDTSNIGPYQTIQHIPLYSKNKGLIAMYGDRIFKLQTGTSVNASKNSQLELFPNPADKMITLKFRAKSSNLNELIEIYNSNAKIIRSIRYSGALTQSIDVSNLAAGTYFIKYGNSINKFIKK